MNSNRLLRALARYYPKRLAEPWDHVGWQLGRRPEEVRKVFLCLDFDKTLLEKVLEEKPDMVISHHPFFFGSRAKILKEDAEKAELTRKLEEAGICLYSYHTNFDTGYPGMNDVLAEALGLLDVRPLEGDKTARGGYLPRKMEVHEFASYAKKALGAPYGLLIAKGKGEVERVALIGGGGSYGHKIAFEEGYDIYVSGDAPHHLRRDIVLEGFNYLDLPHEIESIFVERMKKTLLEIDPTLEVDGVKHEVPPEVI